MNWICLYVLGLSSLSRILHSYGDVNITGEGPQILTYARHSCLFNLFNWFFFSYTLFVTFDITTATLLIRHWSQHQVKGCLRCLNSTTANDVPLIEIEDGVGVTCPMFSWCSYETEDTSFGEVVHEALETVMRMTCKSGIISMQRTAYLWREHGWFSI